MAAEDVVLWGEGTSPWSYNSPWQKERYSFKRQAISREK